MSDKGKAIFDAIREHVADRVAAIVPEVSHTAGEMIGRGATEAAAALFNGGAFVLYGGNELSKVVKPEKEAEAPAPEQERGGRD